MCRQVLGRALARRQPNPTSCDRCSRWMMPTQGDSRKSTTTTTLLEAVELSMTNWKRAGGRQSRRQGQSQCTRSCPEPSAMRISSRQYHQSSCQGMPPMYLQKPLLPLQHLPRMTRQRSRGRPAFPNTCALVPICRLVCGTLRACRRHAPQRSILCLLHLELQPQRIQSLFHARIVTRELFGFGQAHGHGRFARF
ncbi:hypothetical protein BCR44DRAFT_1445885 [Catenaria anguillulae PL171]|uniref:Uncharacterized protein n=1 Tax=Catenaria anguillulae PL171 TaxID=765915 RepID=A0A1Y2H832_9FUNG|nr:hypothetical protein BCR44DRAFT_1445885 [Catenaria anguillulae PL171]